MKESSKCALYKNIKTVFELEPYLYKLPKTDWKYLVKFRCCSHKLEIERGRYVGLGKDLRYCSKCTLDIIGDECHTFFECNNQDIVDLRKRFIPMYYQRNRSMYNFVKLLKLVSDIKTGGRVASFIRFSDIVQCPNIMSCMFYMCIVQQFYCMHKKTVKSSCILYLDNFIYLYMYVCITFFVSHFVSYV